MCNKLTKDQVIQKLIDSGRLWESETKGRFIVKCIDHSNNTLAPETYCYHVFYTNYAGQRVKFAYWPYTVGTQYLK